MGSMADGNGASMKWLVGTLIAVGTVVGGAVYDRITLATQIGYLQETERSQNEFDAHLREDIELLRKQIDIDSNRITVLETHVLDTRR